MDRATGQTYRNGMDRSPEILPPGQYPPQAEPDYFVARPQSVYTRPPQRSHWAMAPATYTLVGINCLVYVWMCLRGFSPWAPTTMDLVRSGANAGPLVLAYGEWWRLITAMFVHVGIIHLGVNMWCLWNLGLLAEPLMGPIGVLAVYLLTGFAGNVLSVARHPGVGGGPQGVVGAGASGAIFGLAGVLIILLKSPLLPIPRVELNKLRRSVIWFAVLNLVLDAGIDMSHFIIQVDNMAHIGGFLSGMAIGLPMVPRIGSRPEVFRNRRKLAIVGMSFLLLLLTFGVYSFWMGRGTSPGLR